VKTVRCYEMKKDGETKYKDICDSVELQVKNLLTTLRNSEFHGDCIKNLYTSDNPEPLWNIIHEQLVISYKNLGHRDKKNYKTLSEFVKDHILTTPDKKLVYVCMDRERRSRR